MLRSWVSRSRGWRLLCLPIVILITAGTTAFLGTTPAEAAGHTVTSVTATPGSQTVGQSVALNAVFSPAQGLLEGAVTISFAIISGPNAGTSIPPCSASGAILVGGATTCNSPTGYVGTNSGTDTILATTGAGDAGMTTTVTWVGIPAIIQMSPLVSFNNVNASAHLSATVLDRQGHPVRGASVAFTVTGPGATLSTHAADGNGVAMFAFSSTTPGMSTIVASVGGVGSSTVTASATANWAGPPNSVQLSVLGGGASGIAPVNGTATVVAAVTDAGGNPAGDNTSVNFTVTGVGNTQGSAGTSGGQASFSFSAAVTGTSTITATATPAPTSNAVTVTWEVPVPTTISLVPKQTHGVIGHPRTLVATVNDQFGQPFGGALVRFALLGANAQPTTSSSTTLADGSAAYIDPGNNLGIDTVVAFVDLQNDDSLDPGDPFDTANIFWVQAPGQGYWLVASDGGIFNYGPSTAFEGSAGSIHLNKPIVGMAGTPSGFGYWLVASDGGIFSYGDARFYGSTGSIHLNKPIVGMAATPDGLGYWLVASDGGIFNYGDAKFFGSTGSIHLNQPIVGMASTSDGQGYWMAASDGGIFNYGDATFQGSTGSIHLNQPIVGMASTPSGGYWLAATDGGIFNFGPAAILYGSLGSTHLNKPIVGIGAISDGSGYFMAASDGGVFNFGPGAPALFGSAATGPLNKPVVGLAVAP